jgi:predicted nuclease of predicted toxin-antitoxin system
LRLLADVNIESVTLAWLEASGHDVLRAIEWKRDASDEVLLDRALSEGRVLLTRDKDFGDLTFRDMRLASGVILLRIHVPNQWERLNILKYWWSEIESNADGALIVVTKDKLRVKLLPA